MDNYLVSARKYRPATFDSVVGQKALTATLKNAVATGRLAHSYLFCGSRGVGKTSCARIFAKTINCEHRTPDGEACNECDSCKAFNAGTSMNIIELDAASNNGIDDMRAIVEQVQVPPSQGQYRVFIVDEVHMLSTAAFNSFLKTLEEPPSYVVFILATTEKHKIIPTILSRCQIYDFHRITIQDMIDHLSYVAKCEGVTVEPAALNIIARKADGAMRDALSIFDQVAASSRGNITYQSTIDNLNVLDFEYYNRLLDVFLANKPLEAWMIYKEIRDRGFDSQFFINGLAGYFRDLMVARDPSTLSLIEAGDDAKQAMAERAAKCTTDFIYKAMCLCNDADLNYRVASNKQFLVELTLAKICQLLSSSSSNGSHGEGQLKPIQATHPRTTDNAQRAPQTNTPPQAAAQPKAAAAKTVAPVHATTAQHIPVAPPAQPAASASIYGRKNATTLKVPSMHMNRTEHTAASQPTASSQIGAKRETPFPLSAFESAWSTYIATHPKSHILINTMRVANPTHKGNGLFTVTVENEMQHDLMERSKPDILTFLRDSLSNDTIELEVLINQGDESKYVLNDRELVAEMVKEYPELKKFIDDFKLSIS